MAMATRGPLTRLYFGFDGDGCWCGSTPGAAQCAERLAGVDLLRIAFFQPQGFELLISHPNWQEPIVQLYHDDVPVSESGVLAAGDVILEVAIPLSSLAAATDDPVQFYIELIKQEAAADRAPTEGAIETTVPSAEFELIMWQA